MPTFASFSGTVAKIAKVLASVAPEVPGPILPTSTCSPCSRPDTAARAPAPRASPPIRDRTAECDETTESDVPHATVGSRALALRARRASDTFRSRERTPPDRWPHGRRTRKHVAAVRIPLPGLRADRAPPSDGDGAGRRAVPRVRRIDAPARRSTRTRPDRLSRDARTRRRRPQRARTCRRELPSGLAPHAPHAAIGRPAPSKAPPPVSATR